MDLMALVSDSDKVTACCKELIVVCGEKRYLNSSIVFCPRTYPAQPDYWTYEVREVLAPVGLPALSDFIEMLRPAHVGTKGIEIVGQAYARQFDITT